MSLTTIDRDREAFACPCCGGSEFRPCGTYKLPPKRDPEGGLIDISYPLVECGSCTHVSAFPRPSEIDIGSYYASSAFWKAQGVKSGSGNDDWRAKLTENSSLWERYIRARRQVDFVHRSMPLARDARIIDLGSGYSPLLYYFAKDGFKNLYALEPFDEICAFLEKQGVTTYPQLIEDFVARDDLPKFDLMVISHTLEHLVDPARAISALARHLSPNGVLFIDVPFQDHLRPFKQGLHYQFFNPRSVSHVADRAGLAVKAWEHDRLNVVESQILKLLYAIYGRSLGKKGGVGPSPKIDFLHRYGWRPVRALLGLKINIFISTLDLRVLLAHKGSQGV